MNNPTTSTAVNPVGERTYADAVARGLYHNGVSGLWGKHDNVRVYWEDSLTRIAMRRFLRARVAACTAEGRGLRILDLGCGAGQGYDLLTRVHSGGRDLGAEYDHLLADDAIELYLGLDLSEEMLEQGRVNLGDRGNVEFARADLRDGLGAAAEQPGFDIYFSSYGALSHLDADGLHRCLAAVARHARPGAVMVLDLLGRLSPEWPGYWAADCERAKTRLYSMSYLYPAETRGGEQVERFPLRFWTGDEVRGLCREVAGETGRAVTVAEMFDRSILIGRHVDTREYDTYLPPLRDRINRLFEQYLRTDLTELMVPPPPADGPPGLCRFLDRLTRSWNHVVEFTAARLGGARPNVVELDGWRRFPPALQMALLTMDRLIDSVSWIDVGDVRANVIEPQLAYVLRRMEYQLQQGRGCGHGLVAVVEIAPASRPAPAA